MFLSHSSAQARDRDRKGPVNSHAKPVRLYLVEDSEIMVRLLRELLGGDPALEVVGQSANAGVAKDEIIALAPDVVIVDIALENSTGFDVLRALAAGQGESRPVVMVLSNFATQRYRDEARRLGADYFFDKNGGIVELLKTVHVLAAGTARRNDSHR
jgi:DNA-binding NarL/FixJ family response regulator